MKNIKQKINSLLNNKQFLPGLTFVLTMCSTLVYAFNIKSLSIFSDGDIISASEMNDNFEYLNERLEALSGNKFQVSTSSAINVPSVNMAVYTQFDFDTLDYDLSDDTRGTDYITNDFFTVPHDGFYQFTITGAFDGAQTQYAYMYIYREVAPSTYSSVTSLYFPSSSGDSRGVRGEFFFNTGDKVFVNPRVGCCSSADSVNFASGVTFSIKEL